MNSRKWFLVQIILWLFFWLALGIFQNRNLVTLQVNLSAYFFQIGLISLLVFIVSPKYLTTKKYLFLGLISLFSVGIFSFTYESIFFNKRVPPPKQERPPVRKERPPERIAEPPEINSAAITLLFSFTYLLALFFEGVQFTQRQEELIIQSKNAELATELKLLKSQVNPHFLFNALNNIYALSNIDSNKTRQSISYLSKMLRYVLYECENAYVSPQKEVEYINNYLQLFALRSYEKYPIQMSSQIKDTTVLIAPMLLIPFVENALKHSHIERIEDSFINIDLRVNKDNISFEVENSKPTKAIHKDKTGGIGLKNVRKRLALLYPNKHELQIIEEGTTFKIKLNINVAGNA